MNVRDGTRQTARFPGFIINDFPPGQKPAVFAVLHPQPILALKQGPLVPFRFRHFQLIGMNIIGVDDILQHLAGHFILARISQQFEPTRGIIMPLADQIDLPNPSVGGFGNQTVTLFIATEPVLIIQELLIAVAKLFLGRRQLLVDRLQLFVAVLQCVFEDFTLLDIHPGHDKNVRNSAQAVDHRGSKQESPRKRPVPADQGHLPILDEFHR
ncbi:hypothetical protein D1872_255770 [compost metagenome]